MKQPEIGDLVKNRLFRNGVQPRIGVVVDGAYEWVEGELVEDSPPTRERSGADRVVAVAMAVTVTGVAVVSLLNFLSSDPEPGDNRRKGRRR